MDLFNLCYLVYMTKQQPQVGSTIETPSGDRGIVVRVTKAYAIFLSEEAGYEKRVHLSAL